ncbi:MAG: prephenate dehydrogenase/arogenate dehydrogenase family protein [Gammaproteobacteria bacterium]|nr:prephenate dehydrogenase/arogenate dehydrogenase family protein [Gammaproteobacteria bacterium]
MIKKLCIIGVGLIGGSLAMALRRAGYCNEVIGAGRSAERLQKALALGVVDSFSTDLAKAVADADVVFVAVPMGAMAAVFKQIDGHLKPGAIVTDGGSAKVSVIEDAKANLQQSYSQFVPGHPIAGTEKSGVEAAFAELYKNRRVIITPTKKTNELAANAVVSMWQAAGAEVESMAAEHHDMVLAGTSHLPHLLAFGLVNCLFENNNSESYFRYAAGGFRDFTRIASSDPVMWRDICLSNKTALLDSLGLYQAELERLKDAITKDDADQLLSYFQSAKESRDKFNF